MLLTLKKGYNPLIGGVKLSKILSIKKNNNNWLTDSRIKAIAYTVCYRYLELGLLSYNIAKELGINVEADYCDCQRRTLVAGQVEICPIELQALFEQSLRNSGIARGLSIEEGV